MNAVEWLYVRKNVVVPKVQAQIYVYCLSVPDFWRNCAFVLFDRKNIYVAEIKEFNFISNETYIIGDCNTVGNIRTANMDAFNVCVEI